MSSCGKQPGFCVLYHVGGRTEPPQCGNSTGGLNFRYFPESGLATGIEGLAGVTAIDTNVVGLPSKSSAR